MRCHAMPRQRVDKMRQRRLPCARAMAPRRFRVDATARHVAALLPTCYAIDATSHAGNTYSHATCHDYYGTERASFEVTDATWPCC